MACHSCLEALLFLSPAWNILLSAGSLSVHQILSGTKSDHCQEQFLGASPMLLTVFPTSQRTWLYYTSWVINYLPSSQGYSHGMRAARSLAHFSRNHAGDLCVLLQPTVILESYRISPEPGEEWCLLGGCSIMANEPKSVSMAT